jgi:hypothetical protein
MVFPTEQTRLLDTNAAGVFQPTASDRQESALYGSVRTAQRGKLSGPSFHEGVDIAAVRRDRSGRPLDSVFAVADGEVAHINRIPSNSGYGRYVVLIHDDPLGTAYTLYAHLSAIAHGLKSGQSLKAGEALGTMGNSANYAIPMTRAHLHLEIGVVANSRFPAWFAAQKLTPDHGAYNGWNLLGVDPLGVFCAQRAQTNFTLARYMADLPAAFEVVVRVGRQPDYFVRYPSLWRDPPFSGGTAVLACTENGVPLSGRNASEQETAALGKGRALVQNVNETALRRNGARLITRRKSVWVLSQTGERWQEIITF